MTMPRPTTIAYTPDSDDAFYYYALQTGKLASPAFDISFHTDHIIALNRAARERRYDVTAVSAVAYPELARDYRILSVGTSVGRGYGPVLVSRDFHALDELHGKRVGVAGIPTTGGFLMKWARPDVQLVEMQFDHIADAVARGQLDAGVMIHEELLFYPEKGLHSVVDLGMHWSQQTGRPLPVGLNIVRRDLGWEASQEICDVIRRSLLYALANADEAIPWACRFGRGPQADCGRQHISLFANEDSVALPEDVREALDYLLRIARAVGLSDSVPPLEFVDGSNQICEAACEQLVA